MTDVLRHRLTQGRVAAWLADAAAEEGRAMPAMAEPGPQLHPGLALYLTAFEDLSPSRPHGGLGGLAAIPFEAIDRYATRFRITDPDAFDDLHRFIRALDDAYLDWAADETERRSSSTLRT